MKKIKLKGDCNISYDLREYNKNVRYLKSLGKFVGCNLLLDENILENLEIFCKILFDDIKVDRVFLLMPKPRNGLDILKYRIKILALSLLYKNLYVDDCLRQIVENKDYDKWETPCHFAKDMISINFDGGVSGCSFDSNKAFYLEKPKDILKIKDMEFKERFNCPYL